MSKVGWGVGRTQVNKRSTYTRPGMHMQQCSVVLKTIVIPLSLCTLVRPRMFVWLPCFVDHNNWSASELLGTATILLFDPARGWGWGGGDVAITAHVPVDLEVWAALRNNQTAGFQVSGGGTLIKNKKQIRPSNGRKGPKRKSIVQSRGRTKTVIPERSAMRQPSTGLGQGRSFFIFQHRRRQSTTNCGWLAANCWQSRTQRQWSAACCRQSIGRALILQCSSAPQIKGKGSGKTGGLYLNYR